MTKNLSKLSFASRLFFVLLSATVLMIIVHLLFQYLNMEVFHQQNGQIYELSNRVDMDDESSIPTWFSQVLFIGIGVSALLASYLQQTKFAKRIWGLLGITSLVFSMDEIATLHEHVLQSIHVLFFQDADPTGLSNAWLLIAPFILTGLAVFFWKASQVFPRRTLGLFITAGLIFITGAVFIDMLTSQVARDTFLSQGILVAIEEGCEFIASLIALYAIVDYLEKHHALRIRQAIAQLRA